MNEKRSDQKGNLKEDEKANYSWLRIPKEEGAVGADRRRV